MLCSPAAGSYVALTVLGRPPGLPLQDEDELEDTDVMEEAELSSCLPASASTGLHDDCGSAEGVKTHKNSLYCI